MQVEVHFIDATTGTFEHVANITVSGEHGAEAALDKAFFHTNNIEGSWSRGPQFEDGTVNSDYNEGTEVLVPLHNYDGKIYGLRSSMVGDRFVFDGKTYVCASFGFDEVTADA